MDTDDIDLQHTVQFSGILIFSPASYLGLSHLVGKIFLEKCDQSFCSDNVVLLIFGGWYGMLENHSINTIIIPSKIFPNSDWLKAHA